MLKRRFNNSKKKNLTTLQDWSNKTEDERDEYPFKTKFEEILKVSKKRSKEEEITEEKKKKKKTYLLKILES